MGKIGKKQICINKFLLVVDVLMCGCVFIFMIIMSNSAYDAITIQRSTNTESILYNKYCSFSSFTCELWVHKLIKLYYIVY